MKISAQNLADLIVQKNKSSDAEFKQSINLAPKSDTSNQGASTASMEIILPFESELQSIESSLREVPSDTIMSEAKAKSGNSYDLLVRRAKIIKTNNENRYDIAKLLIATSKLSKPNQDLVASTIRSGKIDQAIDLTGEQNITDLGRYLCRCGINCTTSGSSLVLPEPEELPKEISVTLGNKKIWVGSNQSKQIEENMDKIRKLNPLIQMKNAERHVRSFNEVEEKEFVDIQHQYLSLLKEQDEFVKKFEEEDKLTIEVQS